MLKCRVLCMEAWQGLHSLVPPEQDTSRIHAPLCCAAPQPGWLSTQGIVPVICWAAPAASTNGHPRIWVPPKHIAIVSSCCCAACTLPCAPAVRALLLTCSGSQPLPAKLAASWVQTVDKLLKRPSLPRYMWELGMPWLLLPGCPSSEKQGLHCNNVFICAHVWVLPRKLGLRL